MLVEETTQWFNVVVVEEAVEEFNNSMGGNQDETPYGGPPEYVRRLLLGTIFMAVLAVFLQMIPAAISRGLPVDSPAPSLLLAHAVAEIFKRIAIFKLTLCGIFGKFAFSRFQFVLVYQL